MKQTLRTSLVALGAMLFVAPGCGGDSATGTPSDAAGSDAITTDASPSDSSVTDASLTDSSVSDSSATDAVVTDSATTSSDSATDGSTKGDSGATDAVADATPPTINSVGHVIVIYMENHSFDNLYGGFAGANGLFKADGVTLKDEVVGKQLDSTKSPAAPYTTLPMTLTQRTTNADGGSTTIDSPFPTTLANQPFDIDMFEDSTLETADLVHRFWNNQMQIHGGANDLFAAYSDADGLSMGYYKTSALPTLAYSTGYVVCDAFFQGAFGGSFLNHQWLISAQSPVWNTDTTSGGQPIPSSYVASLDSTTHMLPIDPMTGKPNPVNGGADKVTPAGWDAAHPTVQYGVNTLQPIYTPHAGGASATVGNLLPGLKNANIGDRLTAAGVDWAWFAGGWNSALAGTPDPLFQFHHQPFVYYDNYKDGSAAKTAHLKDETDFMTALAAGTIPPVSFVKPIGANNEHPGYATLVAGENHLKALLDAIKASPVWKDAVVIVTYDENGGFYDHVAPPSGKTDGTTDVWGPGTRVPALIISPFAKTGYVDHTPYDTTSILAFIEKRWSLMPLSTRDKAANPLSGAFVF